MGRGRERWEGDEERNIGIERRRVGEEKDGEMKRNMRRRQEEEKDGEMKRKMRRR